MTNYQERMERYRQRAAELAMKDQSEEWRQAAQAIKRADRIVIGGAAGLSATGGLDYQSESVLQECFPKLSKRGYHTLWEALWDEKRSVLQKWSMQAAEVFWIEYNAPLVSAYLDLFELVKEKNYFVLTSNIDNQFYKAGFDKDLIFAPQNSIVDFQCSIPCCNQIWDGRPIYKKILDHTNFTTYSCREEDIPRCPHCGAPAVLNMRGQDCFIADKVMRTRAAFEAFIAEAREETTVFLELGVGFNSPGVIRHPFQRLVRLYPHATLIRMNRDFPMVPEQLRQKAIEIGGDIGISLKKIRSYFFTP